MSDLPPRFYELHPASPALAEATKASQQRGCYEFQLSPQGIEIVFRTPQDPQGWIPAVGVVLEDKATLFSYRQEDVYGRSLAWKNAPRASRNTLEQALINEGYTLTSLQLPVTTTTKEDLYRLFS